jgi:hypothetical protein
MLLLPVKGLVFMAISGKRNQVRSPGRQNFGELNGCFPANERLMN